MPARFPISFPPGTRFFLWQTTREDYLRVGPGGYYHAAITPYLQQIRLWSSGRYFVYDFRESHISLTQDFTPQHGREGWVEVTESAYRRFLIETNGTLPPLQALRPEDFIAPFAPFPPPPEGEPPPIIFPPPPLPPTNHKLGAPKGKLP